jgi:hypothetical protein
VIRHAPAASRATIIRQRRHVRGPDVTPLAAILAAASILVVHVAATALIAVASGERQLRRLAREKSPARVFIGGPTTSWSRQNADRVERVRDAMDQYRPTGVLHLRLNPPAVPPRRYVECHSVALFPSGT